MIKLSKRLSAVAFLVKPNSLVADIGCDHGYISAYLAQNNIAKHVVATDINEGPLCSCKSLIEKMGLNSYVDARLCSGLDDVKECECTTIIIAGMGGELIENILLSCDFASKKELVLQPMTHPEIVRRYLYEHSFVVTADIIVQEGSHHYNVIAASPNGSKSSYNNVDLFLGNITDFSDKSYFKGLINYLENRKKSGIDYTDVINAIKEKI